MDNTLEVHIEHQKKLSSLILRELRHQGFNAIIAGGAVRDWHYGIPAKDLDIFIAGGPERNQIRKIFDVKTRPLSEEKYERSGFEGFECKISNEKAQFLFHAVDDPREIPPKFPISICQCYWDGEDEWWFSQWFSIGNRYRALIYTGDDVNFNYLAKVQDKYPGWKAYLGEQAFFETGFQPESQWHTNFVVDDLAWINNVEAVDF